MGSSSGLPAHGSDCLGHRQIPSEMAGVDDVERKVSARPSSGHTEFSFSKGTPYVDPPL